MANKTASFQIRLSYEGPDDETVTAPHLAIAVAYGEGAQLVGGIDIPDLAASGTEYEVPFGTIASATAMLIENRSGQDLHVRINGQPGSVSGTLASGTVTLALASVTGEHLSVERTSSAGTPGILSVRRSGGNVIVESWLAGTGIQTADTSVVAVYQGGSPDLFRLPDGGTLLVAAPDAPGGTPLASASVLLTAEQAGAGSVVTKVFGDPT